MATHVHPVLPLQLVGVRNLVLSQLGGLAQMPGGST